ncbi:MAG: hypothetical protein K8R67_01555 [Desulfobacteraceae bacterium]|nr:hypothetical protein [Desulfobacteraceae bacterium]
MRYFYLCIFLILLIPNIVCGTVQEPDTLLYKSKSYDLYTTPLGAYFHKQGHGPAFDVE